MPFRVSAVVLAFVLFAAPLSPALCGVTCASHEMSVTGHSEHHSCHEAAPDVATVSPAEHPCGHQKDGLVAVEQLAQVLNSPALVTSSVAAFIAPIVTNAPRSATATVSPPGPTLSTQLRL